MLTKSRAAQGHMLWNLQSRVYSTPTNCLKLIKGMRPFTCVSPVTAWIANKKQTRETEEDCDRDGTGHGKQVTILHEGEPIHFTFSLHPVRRGGRTGSDWRRAKTSRSRNSGTDRAACVLWVDVHRTGVRGVYVDVRTNEEQLQLPTTNTTTRPEACWGPQTVALRLLGSLGHLRY
jgi:hypothetical protein